MTKNLPATESRAAAAWHGRVPCSRPPPCCPPSLATGPGRHLQLQDPRRQRRRAGPHGRDRQQRALLQSHRRGRRCGRQHLHRRPGRPHDPQGDALGSGHHPGRSLGAGRQRRRHGLGGAVPLSLCDRSRRRREPLRDGYRQHEHPQGHARRQHEHDRRHGGRWAAPTGRAGPAQFNVPVGIAVDGSGNVYVADTDKGTIRLISAEPGRCRRWPARAGQTGSADGTGSARPGSAIPRAWRADPAGNIYVADFGNSAIRKVASGGCRQHAAGQLPASREPPTARAPAARFNHPESAGGRRQRECLCDRHLQPDRPQGLPRRASVSTLAGTPGLTGTWTDRRCWCQARQSSIRPGGIAVAGAGNVYIADTGNHTLSEP